jgi:hypothetical protein
MDDDDLASSLEGLSGLLTGRLPLRDTLVHIAEFAVQAVPGAEGAGLTMLDGDRPQTVVASAEFVRAVDDVQYGLGEGPCLLAVESRDTQTSGSLGGEARWPRLVRASGGWECTACCRCRCCFPTAWWGR